MMTSHLLWLALLSSTEPATAPTDNVTFDGVTYSYAASSKSGDATLIEFVPTGQSLADWKTLLSFQCHPSATSLIKDVFNPYLQARKGVIAVAPEVYKNNDALDDLTVFTFLGKRGMPHLEFVVTRFAMDKAGGAVVIAYSKRFPMRKDVAVPDTLESKPRFMKEMTGVTVEQVTTACAKHGTPATGTP